MNKLIHCGGSIRAAWHWTIRWNALLVCVERVNFSELEIFILSQVTIHSASACRNWAFLSPGIQQHFLVGEMNWTCSYNSKQSTRCKIGCYIIRELSFHSSRGCWVKYCYLRPEGHSTYNFQGGITEAGIFGAARRWASNFLSSSWMWQKICHLISQAGTQIPSLNSSKS